MTIKDSKYVKINNVNPLHLTIENSKYYTHVFLEECLYKLQMLYYDRIDNSEEIDIIKTSASKECKICKQCNIYKNGYRTFNV